MKHLVDVLVAQGHRVALARDIAALEVASAEERKWLIRNASRVADLAERLWMLERLDKVRANERSLERALLERMGVSLAETNAFLNAQNQVIGYVRRFMDASDWFVDTPVPADLRSYVDGILKPRFDALADRMAAVRRARRPDEGQPRPVGGRRREGRAHHAQYSVPQVRPRIDSCSCSCSCSCSEMNRARVCNLGGT